jgi:hypothetical protein
MPQLSLRPIIWLKMKNPACTAVRREAEEDWGELPTHYARRASAAQG